MVDNYLLEYLVAFAETGTIAGVAEELNVTQPTVSRGLSKLEQLLDVQLFDRQPQKITLTAAGEFAAQRAAVLLNQHRDFASAVQHFVVKNRYLRIGGTIPGPLLLLQSESNNDQLVFDHEALPTDSWQAALVNRQYGLIFTSQEVQTPEIESRFIGQEKLAIKITKFNPLFHHQTVTFDELNGHEFVVAANIGEWKPIIEHHLPHTQFLYQSQPAALRELIRYSNFPIFKTNLTHYLEQQEVDPVDKRRKYIPITDTAASLDIYAAYLKVDRQTVKKVVDQATSLFNRAK